jgi:ubiquitin-protein ligase
MSVMKLYIQDNSGNRYESTVEPGTTIGNIAADFFEAMEWGQQEEATGGQRAVAEIFDPQTDKYTRLRPDQTVEEAKIPADAILRIYAESVAGSGAVDPRRRLAQLKTDKNEMEKLVADNPAIRFITDGKDIPSLYTVTFRCKSFIGPPIKEGGRPETGDQHRVSIYLSTEYPREAPLLNWETPIFHPNVGADGQVCLGQLLTKYLPGMGLRRVVLMVDEMLHWRNYDMLGAFNIEAAQWAYHPDNWGYIEEIGGIGFNIPYSSLIDPDNWGDTEKADALFKGVEQPEHLLQQWYKENQRPRIQFDRVNKS